MFVGAEVEMVFMNDYDDDVDIDWHAPNINDYKGL